MPGLSKKIAAEKENIEKALANLNNIIGKVESSI